MALVATATLIEACGEDPYAMTACEVMDGAMGGRPRGEKARMMMSSMKNIGCSLPWAIGGKPRGDKGAMMQGTIERLIPDGYTSSLAYRRE